ncbi:hypothetical protein PTSG_04862 [Salpingoeca rosetta]|uniref:Protein kinase domain-containing protein n=1 Tax=Salpingoeca rosetta (strain ATCC 50818 / BSB-021) TaxID=946362 RepID=F2U8U7_SALR5|nr:uncharacterized protein PTSG_04862 [Salpingoeca rosetta]EGD73150.1 hypothetical protein PTSG_04862 [Salpingoeca rosetta]|eukprot:XP_004994181.1 hypothetical protein PTSG_04862 [Salpingoeca rosetta]
MKLVVRYVVAGLTAVLAALVLVGLASTSWWASVIHGRAPALKVLPPIEHSAVFTCAQGFYINPHDGQCRPCPRGTFTSPPSIVECVPLLTCDEISRDIGSLAKFSTGGVKTLFRGRWKGPHVHAIDVLVARPHPGLVDDFKMGKDNLDAIGPHPLIIRPIGHCNDPPMLVFPLYRLGSALNVNAVAAQVEDALELRLQLVEDYASILVHLHHQASSNGAFVMCDADSVGKLLSQFLISDDYRLILNDVDALPLATPTHKIKCGHRELSGDFVGA